MLQGKKNNRLSSTTVGSINPVTELYTHDAHGNMTKMPHLTVMQWDFKDQLNATSRQIVNGGTPETTYYVYDAAGQRVRKVTERQNGTRKDERIYIGGFEVYREYEGDGTSVNLEREALHVTDDKQRITLVETRTQGADGLPRQLIRYQFGNHLGSASLELDDGGKIISYEEYYAYGSTSYQAGRSAAEVNLKRYRYTGMERDEENGFAYHGARYHAQWLGRWVTADPIGIIGGISLYVYADDSPCIRVDTQGYEPQKPAPDAPTKPRRTFKANKAVGRAYDKAWFNHFNSRSDTTRIIRQSKWKDLATGKSKLVLGRWRQPDLGIEFNTAPGAGIAVETGSPPSFAGATKMKQAAQDLSAMERGLVLGNAEEGFLHIEGRFEARGLPVVGDGGNVPGSNRVFFHEPGTPPGGSTLQRGSVRLGLMIGLALGAILASSEDARSAAGSMAVGGAIESNSQMLCTFG